MTDKDQMMLFLYKDVGLLWENTLSKNKNRDMCSMNSNKGLWTFFHRNKHVSYNASSTNDFENKVPENNQFLFTNTSSSVVKSLIQHMRNSIMHGNYKIKYKDSKAVIEFYDYYINTITMKGNIEFDKLKDLINTIKKYQPK